MGPLVILLISVAILAPCQSISIVPKRLGHQHGHGHKHNHVHGHANWLNKAPGHCRAAFKACAAGKNTTTGAACSNQAMTYKLKQTGKYIIGHFDRMGEKLVQYLPKILKKTIWEVSKEMMYYYKKEYMAHHRYEAMMHHRPHWGGYHMKHGGGHGEHKKYVTKLYSKKLGKSFCVVRKKVNWYTAQLMCEKHNKKLADLRNNATLQFLLKATKYMDSVNACRAIWVCRHSWDPKARGHLEEDSCPSVTKTNTSVSLKAKTCFIEGCFVCEGQLHDHKHHEHHGRPGHHGTGKGGRGMGRWGKGGRGMGRRGKGRRGKDHWGKGHGGKDHRGKGHWDKSHGGKGHHGYMGYKGHHGSHEHGSMEGSHEHSYEHGSHEHGSEEGSHEHSYEHGSHEHVSSSEDVESGDTEVHAEPTTITPTTSTTD